MGKWDLAEKRQRWSPSKTGVPFQMLYLCWQLPYFQKSLQRSCSFQDRRILGPALQNRRGRGKSITASLFLPSSVSLPWLRACCIPGWLVGSQIGPGPDTPWIPNREHCIGCHILYSQHLESVHSSTNSETTLPFKKFSVPGEQVFSSRHFQVNGELCTYLFFPSGTSLSCKSPLKVR